MESEAPSCQDYHRYPQANAVDGITTTSFAACTNTISWTICRCAFRRPETYSIQSNLQCEQYGVSICLLSLLSHQPAIVKSIHFFVTGHQYNKLCVILQPSATVRFHAAHLILYSFTSVSQYLHQPNVFQSTDLQDQPLTYTNIKKKCQLHFCHHNHDHHPCHPQQKPQNTSTQQNPTPQPPYATAVYPQKPPTITPSSPAPAKSAKHDTITCTAST